MITQIELFGGSVIDFAGDSMLCWFDDLLPSAPMPVREEGTGGRSSAHRAVACGAALQDAMRAFADIVLPDRSTTTLTLKIGIASGAARRFVVGDPKIRRMDVVAGDTIARTASAERFAQKGEMIVDEATANLLGQALSIREWREEQETHERFAVIAGLAQPIETPTRMEVEARDLSLEVIHPWLLPELVERERAGQGSLLIEFRPCVALFVRFLGIDYNMDEAGMQLDRFICRAQAIVARDGGAFLQITIGDK